MKKLILSLVAPFLLLSALSAQITQQEADEIVKERLDSEINIYAVYAKEDLHTERTTIATATGETLELDYSCWVYYVSYGENAPGKYLIVKESSGNLLEINAKNDTGPNDLAEWRAVEFEISFEEYSLEGTSCQWINLNYDETIIVINNAEELESYINCTESNYPEIDFTQHTLLLASGEADFDIYKIFVTDLMRLSFDDCELNLKIILNDGEAIEKWAIGLITEKLRQGSAVALNITISPQACGVNNPLTGLPWLKTLIDEIITDYQNGNPIDIKIYQCVYGDNEIGFLVDNGNIKPFYNCDGEILCIMDGVAEETCSWLNIISEELIWDTSHLSYPLNPILIGKGHLSGEEGIPKQNLVITNTEDWENLISSMNSVQNVTDDFTETDINFDEYLIISVLYEVKPNGGWSIDITDAIVYEDIVVFTVKNLNTGDKIYSQCQPFHIVKIPVTEKPIYFDMAYENCDWEEITPFPIEEELESGLNDVFSKDNDLIADTQEVKLYAINTAEEFSAICSDPEIVSQIDFEHCCIIWGKIWMPTTNCRIARTQLSHCDSLSLYKYEVDVDYPTSGYTGMTMLYFWNVYSQKIDEKDVLLFLTIERVEL
jgi:hypothetical protein